jgi:protein phosphatase
LTLTSKVQDQRLKLHEKIQMSDAIDPHIDIGFLSHPGEKREINEDSFGISAYQLGKELTPVVLAVVADGIGGHQAGEVASQLTVDTIMNSLTKEDAQEPLHQLRKAVKSAGAIVAETALRSSEFFGMGSTVAIAWVINKKLYTTHVGDSRIYLLRNNNLIQVSTDHTWVQEAIKHEIIRPEEARNHPRAHVLHQALGSQEPPEPDFRLRLTTNETDTQSENNQGLKLICGDKILLCSDGLTDLVEDHEIQTALIEQGPEDGVQSLVSLARARGGHDNITAIILGVPQDWPKEGLASPQRKNTLRFLIIALIGAFILIVLAFITWFVVLPIFKGDEPTPTPSTEISTPVPDSLQESAPSPFQTMDEITSPTITTTPLPTDTASPVPTINEPTLTPSTEASTPVPQTPQQSTPSPSPTLYEIPFPSISLTPDLTNTTIPLPTI